MRGAASHQRIRKEIAGIEALSFAALKDKYKAITNDAPPKRIGRKLLILAVTYALQGEASGQERAVEKAIANLMQKTTKDGARPRPQRLSPGVRLLREWRGKTLVVDIVDGGYLFDKAIYKSLSAIASIATGSRRNGPAFFGLRNGASL